MQYPLISCLMVTTGIRLKQIDYSIFSYITQTYENKELIIVTDCNFKQFKKLTKLLKKYQNENISLVFLNKKLIMGELRNVSLSISKGEYWIVWDDDDFHHKDAIKDQYLKITSGDFDYCVLRNYMTYFYDTQNLTVNDFNNRTIEGPAIGMPPTILVKKSVNYKYPVVQFHEDIDIFQHKFKGCILENMPHLYVYMIHGKNSFNYNFHNKLCEATKIKFDFEAWNKVQYLFKYAKLRVNFNRKLTFWRKLFNFIAYNLPKALRVQIL